jgi:hypothetical protein
VQQTFAITSQKYLAFCCVLRYISEYIRRSTERIGMSHRYDDLITEAMAELADDVGGLRPIETALAELTRAAVRLIEGVDCADILLIKGGEFRSVGATSPIAAGVDLAQRWTGEGPCLDAAERDVIVRCNDLGGDCRWPRFAQEARAAGVLSVMSFRLYTHAADSGALNLFGFAPGSFAAEPEAVGAMLATHAAVMLLSAERQHQFESALASRDIIGQAKGIIMERFDVDAIQAFELLARISQRSNKPVRIVAARLVKRGEKRRSAQVSGENPTGRSRAPERRPRLRLSLRGADPGSTEC